MYRKSKEKDSLIEINGKKYRIKDLVGRGGASLVYLAEELEGGLHPWIIKEFFPQNNIAYRDANGKIVAYDGQKYVFNEMKDRFFGKEPDHGNCLGIACHQVYSFDEVDPCSGFAKMRKFSEDTISLLELVKEWEGKKLSSGRKSDFDDMHRCKYALRVVAGLLLVLEKMHNLGILHLDISHANLVLAGLDKDDDGAYSNVFVFDFGCSVRMNEIGQYIKKDPRFSSYTHGFGAPEIKDMQEVILNPKTDLYAVGALLLFLLCGALVVDDQWNMHDNLWRRFGFIGDCLDDLDIPDEFKEKLFAIIKGCCAKKPADRIYASAREMFEAIQILIKELENYEKPHLFLPEIKPVSPFFVKYSDDVMNQIESVLKSERVMYVWGMSGIGKSELLRQFASECCQNIPVLEIYFPEAPQDYSLGGVLSSLTFINIKEEELEKKEKIFYRFLEQEVLLLLHNFNAHEDNVAFIEQKLRRKNVKILISTQSTREQLEVQNVPERCMLHLTSNVNLCTKIFKKVFEKHRREIPGTMAEIARLSELLFCLPLMVCLVATQLVRKRDDQLKALIISLEQNGVDNAFKESIKYRRDYYEMKIEGTPFMIMCKVVRMQLPVLSIIEEECLQIMSKLPGVWVCAEDIERIIGDMPDKSDFSLAYDAISSLIDKNLLQSKKENNLRYISIHALMASIVLVNIDGESYVREPSVEFLQHIERNAFVDEFDLETGWNEFSGPAFYYSNNLLKILGHLRYWYDKVILNKDSDSLKKVDHNIMMGLKRESALWLYGMHAIVEKGFLNDNYTLSLQKKNPGLIYEQVIIYCKEGVILLKELQNNENEEGECNSDFEVIINAAIQNSQRYYRDDTRTITRLDEKLSNVDAISCSILIKCIGNVEGTVIIPDDFLGIPITNVEYINNYQTDATILDLVLPKECVRFTGNSDRVSDVIINPALEILDFKSINIRKFTIPANVRYISERSITPFVEYMDVDMQNNAFIELEGIVYTRNMKTILFIPPQKRILSISLPESVTTINFFCLGYDENDFLLQYQSFYQLVWLYERRNTMPALEKIILTTINKKSIEEIFMEILHILAFYISYVKDKEIPFYFLFFWSYAGLHPYNQDTNERTLLTVDEAINHMNFVINRTSGWKRNRSSQCWDEHINKINIENFMKICKLFFEEGLRKTKSLISFLLLNNLSLYDSKLISTGIGILKEKKQISCLQQAFLSPGGQIDIVKELLDICDSIKEK